MLLNNINTLFISISLAYRLPTVVADLGNSDEFFRFYHTFLSPCFHGKTLSGSRNYNKIIEMNFCLQFLYNFIELFKSDNERGKFVHFLHVNFLHFLDFYQG